MELQLLQDTAAPMKPGVAQAIVAERGTPQTAEQARQFAEDAYAEVNRFYGQRAARPTRPTPSATRTSRPRPGSPRRTITRVESIL